MNILLVEDDPDLRALLAEFLVEEGYVVTCAAHGADALAQLTSTQTLPHLILLDLLMPIMPGWNFWARLAANPDWAAIAVVVMSASPMLAERLTPPVAAVLDKPLDLNALLMTLQQYCPRGPASTPPSGYPQ